MSDTPIVDAELVKSKRFTPIEVELARQLERHARALVVAALKVGHWSEHGPDCPLCHAIADFDAFNARFDLPEVR